MSKSFTGEASAEMTEGQTADPAPDKTTLARAMNDVAVKSSGGARPHRTLDEGSAILNTALEVARDKSVAVSERSARRPRQAPGAHKTVKRRALDPPVKQRFGLPQGFVPRWQRFDRGILLEQNIYRLPNGREFIPSHPIGTLGARQHTYALLTAEQYLHSGRGSVYVRNDGRIFDYSVDSGVPGGDLFDTGYTIYDLERTGRYAPSLGRRKKKHVPARVRRAVTAGSRTS